MTRLIRRHPVPAFFALAWGLSWLAMVPLALARHGVFAPLPGWPHHLSAPSISSVGLLAVVSSTVFTALGIVAVFRLGSAAPPRHARQTTPEHPAPGRMT